MRAAVHQMQNGGRCDYVMIYDVTENALYLYIYTPHIGDVICLKVKGRGAGMPSQETVRAK